MIVIPDEIIALEWNWVLSLEDLIKNEIANLAQNISNNLLGKQVALSKIHISKISDYVDNQQK